MTNNFISRVFLPICPVLLLLFWTKDGTAQNGWSLVYSPVEPSEHFSGVYAVDQNTFVLSSEWGRVYRSTNGGQSVSLYQVPGNFSIFNDISFFDTQNGFIGGGCWFPTSECISSVILRTADGGANWTAHQVSTGVGILTALHTFPDGSAYALGDYSGVYHFDPQTNLWDSLGTPAGLAPGYHLDLRLVNQETGFLLHHGIANNTLYRTDNGGQSWVTVNAAIPDLANESNLHFFDGQRGLLPGSGGTLYQTTDGGINWIPVEEFGVDEVISHIDFVDQQTGYIAVYNQQTQTGRIYRSNDGGSSWTAEATTDGYFFTDFHFADKNNGYALDSGSRVFRRSGTNAVSGLANDSAVKVCPNPAADQFVVKLSADLQYEQDNFRLYDATGRLVRTVSLTGPQTTISCAGMQNGFYWYQWGDTVGRIIISH